MSVRFWVLMLVAVFFFGIIAGIYLTWDRGERLHAVPNKTKAGEALLPRERVDISAERIELSQGSGGAMEWSLAAGHGEYDQVNKLVVITDPDVTYFMGEERRPLRVKASRGSVSQESGAVRLWDGVGADYDHFTINATRLEYAGRNKTLRLDGEVRLTRAGLAINASTVDMDVKTRDITALGPIRAVVAESYLGMGGGANATAPGGNASGGAAAGNATDAGGLESLERATRLLPSGGGDAPGQAPPAPAAKSPAKRKGKKPPRT